MSRRFFCALTYGIAFALLFFPLAFAEQIQYDSSNRRDPFIPLVGPGGIKSGQMKSTLQVEGIIYDPKGGSLVLINGDYYKEGAEVNHSIIKTILKNKVVVKQDEEEKTLWLREEENTEQKEP